MAEEEAQDSSYPREEAEETTMSTKCEEEGGGVVEDQIRSAMLCRALHFKQQADSLTFEGVRRLLEKDLQLETCALDKHKKYIRQCLTKCLAGVNDDNASKNSEDTVEKKDRSPKEEVVESPKEQKGEKDAREPTSEYEEKMEHSPVMGLLTGNATTTTKSEETQGAGKKEVPSEIAIKKALSKRATYFRANSHEITMAGVRRLLEEDLKLDKGSLDPFKKFISRQLDEVLKSPKAPESVPRVQEKNSAKGSLKKMLKKISADESSDSLEGESEEVEDRVKPKKKVAPKGKVQKSEELKKCKRPAMEPKIRAKKRSKLAETSGENSGSEGGNDFEDDRSQSSAEKLAKKKEVPAPAYGEQVEHLKSIIKSCGMSVPPSVYKRAKQAPENKREASLIKELEEILRREGLDSNPSEKEIKEVRRRKERAKELEGIDMSNIVLSSRRRSTTSFIPPPKPKTPVESDDDDEDSDNNDTNGEDDDEAESLSEEFNGEDDESD